MLVDFSSSGGPGAGWEMPDEYLHGYAEFQRTFIPCLVKLDPAGRYTAPAYPDGAPVVRVHGGRGTGKTALCRQLHRAYANRLPVVRWPAAETPHAPARSDDDLLASSALVALYWFVLQLSVDVPKSRLVDFPRFTYGLLAATTLSTRLGDDGPEERRGGRGAADDAPGPSLADIERFADASSELETALHAATPENGLRTLFAELLRSSVPMIPALAPGLPNLEGLIQIFVERYVRVGRLSRSALVWWEGELDEYVGRGVGRLHDYTVNLAIMEAASARGDLERRLTAAFLADIDAHHHAGWRWREQPLPLILLDDTHTPAGEHLLRLLTDAYVRAGGPHNERGRAVARPVLVATQLTTEDCPTDAGTSVAQIDSGLWSTPRTDDTRAWQLWLETPTLRAGSIGSALRGPDWPSRLPDPPKGLPDLVHRVSSGRAGSAWILLRAAREDLRTEHRSDLRECHRERPGDLGAALLGLRAAARDGEADTAEALLRHLVPRAEMRDRLELWSAALHRADLPYLSASSVARRPTALTEVGVRQARDFVEAGHWTRRPWACSDGFVPVIPDRALRELLLHRLRTGEGPRDPDEAAARDERWTALHEAARRRHTTEGADERPTASFLYYSLALGRRHAVLASLHERFEQTGRRDWLSCLQFVCAAPQPPPGYAARHPEPPVHCTACGGSSPDDRHRAIDRLAQILRGLSTLASVYTDDPESPDNSLRLTLNGFDIAYADGDDVTRNAARRWPRLLAAGRRVPELPICRGDE